jgi:hypothetical protein
VLTFHATGLAPSADVIVADQVKDTVHQQMGDLELEAVTAALCLTLSGLHADHHVA